MEKFLILYITIVVIYLINLDNTNYFIKKTEYKCTNIQNNICYVYEKVKE